MKPKLLVGGGVVVAAALAASSVSANSVVLARPPGELVVRECFAPTWQEAPARTAPPPATTGSLRVYLMDVDDLEVPGVEVTVSTISGEALIKTTDALGMALFPRLSPGTYEIRTFKPGFGMVHMTDVRVLAGQDTAQSLELRAGGAAEVSEIVGRHAVNVEETGRTTTLDKNYLNKVPSGRSYQSAITMAQGATGGSGGNPNMASGAYTENTYMLDGANVTDGVRGASPKPGEPQAWARGQEPSSNGRVGKFLDWGGEIYLSNDDSMSLASAQRLLWAAERGHGWTVDQVRPHELLNYFQFDAATPDADEVLDVTVSAERVDRDHLKIAMTVAGAPPSGRPADLTFVLDRSGSMSDEGRMAYLKRGLKLATNQLQNGDRVDLVLFDEHVCTPVENFVVGRDDMGILRGIIDRIAPRGSTDVGLGLEEGYRVAQAHEGAGGRNRRMVLITDALLNTGDIDHQTVSEIGRAYDQSGIRLTGIGVGTEFNDDVLNKLTEKGQGSYLFLGSEAVVDRIFGAGWPSVIETVAEDVHFKLDLPPSLALERFYGEEASAVKADVQPTHFAAGTRQTFFQDVVVKGGEVVSHEPVTFEARFTNPRTGKAEVRTFTTQIGAMLETDPHNVRKAAALMAWSDVLAGQALKGECDYPAARRFREAARLIEGDAELDHIADLVDRDCKQSTLKVRIDADVAVSDVVLVCGSGTSHQALIGGTSVVTLEGRPGVCDLRLQGARSSMHRVVMPQLGGDVRCLVRGGRSSCSW